MFSSVLVANRGEIARRVFRTARALGLRCIAVYSDADAVALHVREADAAVCLGPGPAAESYLRGDAILEAARATGAAAIHPGYGFLSENPAFAEAVIAAGLVWIGPPPAAIAAMGLKDEAKRIAEEAGVPVLPGYRGADQSLKRLQRAAAEIGFPVLIKAVAGGGGRGIREARDADGFKEALAGAQREAGAAFGDDRVMIEKLVERPRHIEVQVFGDRHGGLVHLYERDCSLQRRRQKVIEEAPAPGMTPEVRAAMTDAALKVARAVGYQNAGTVEFIVDGTGPLRPDGFWFLEMNTRLQVEHPVTEAVTGLDLVDWQLRVAAGEPLPLAQDQIPLTGWAIEARICAEDPAEGFRPSVGRLTAMTLPGGPGRRLDAGFGPGDAVSPFYDSLIAKAIAHGPDREAARRGLLAFLEDAQIGPLPTNAAMLVQLLQAPEVIAGEMDVGLIARRPELLQPPPEGPAVALAAAAIWAEAAGRSNEPDPWSRGDGFRLNGSAQARVSFAARDAGAATATLAGTPAAMEVRVGEAVHRVEGLARHRGRWRGLVTARVDGAPARAWLRREADGAMLHQAGAAFPLERPYAAGAASGLEAGDDVKAPLPGRIAALFVAPGQAVRRGEALAVLEAMKMEHALKALRDGVIAETLVEEGAQVKEGAVIVRLQPMEDDI